MLVREGATSTEVSIRPANEGGAERGVSRRFIERSFDLTVLKIISYFLNQSTADCRSFLDQLPI